MTDTEKLKNLKLHITDIGIVLRRQLVADGYTNITQVMAEKAVCHGLAAIREDLCASKCPSCGTKGTLSKDYYSEDGVKYPCVSCVKCHWWG